MTPPRLGFRLLAALAGLVLGVLLGVLGVALEPAGPRLGSLLVSVGVLLAVVGNPVAVALSARASESRIAAAAPLVGWLVVAFLSASSTSAGDVLLTAHDAAAQVFLWGGCLAGVAAVVLAPVRAWRWDGVVTGPVGRAFGVRRASGAEPALHPARQQPMKTGSGSG